MVGNRLDCKMGKTITEVQTQYYRALVADIAKSHRKHLVT